MTVSEDQLRAAAKILAARAMKSAGAAAAASAATRAAKAHDPKAEQKHEFGLLLDGFNALAVSAKNGKGKTLDSLNLQGDLKPADRTFLEHIRRVLIDAQAGPDEHKKAKAAWAPVETKLHDTLSKARAAGVPVDYLDTTEDNIAIISESYIGAAHKGPIETENNQDYAEVLNGVHAILHIVEQGYTDFTDGVQILDLEKKNAEQRKLLGDVTFQPDLNKRHHQLLESFRHVFVLARTDGRAHDAVSAWNQINEDVSHVLKGAAQMGVASTTETAERINKLHHSLLEGYAYYEDHQKSLTKTKAAVSNPKEKLHDEQLREAVVNLQHVDELDKKAGELGAKALLQGAFEQHGMNGELAGALFEWVHGGFEIHELLEEWKKKDLIGKGVTVADLTDKVLTVAHAGAEAAFHYMKDYAETALKTAVEDAAKEWKAISKWAAENLETLESIGRKLVIVSLVVSAIKIFDLVREGKYADAAKEAVSTVIGLGAGMAAGAAGSAMFAGIAVTIEAEIEGLKGAAAMIAYAREENEKAALGDFFETLKFAYDGEAKHLIADLDQLATVTDQNERKIVEANVDDAAKAWAKDLGDLSEQVSSSRKDRIGGHPEFLEKLGPAAVSIMKQGVADFTPAGLGQQISTVFAGANVLAAHIGETRKAQFDEAEKERKAAEEEARKNDD
jgi:hypothetical protein